MQTARMLAPDAAPIAPGLTDVPETMLWTLHHRASEASRDDGVLTDPDSLRIYRSLDYDFRRHFGSPDGALAARAAAIDRIVIGWIARHPDGLIVSLGEGLETQARRVDNGRIKWLSVDLPDAIRLRERFLPPTERFRHLAVSALDPAWMDAVDASKGVLVVAQGLLMYLRPAKVRTLLAAIADRFDTAEVVFDVVPRAFSRMTRFGLHKTWHYRLPPMPWGINRNEITATLRRWIPNLANVTVLDYRIPRGLPAMAERMMQTMPILRHEVPSLVHMTLAANVPASNH